jgi:hypothetical protein
MAGAPKGNTNASKDNRMVTDALKRAAAQNPDKLREACLKVLQDAAEGNLAAFNTLADRLDGRPSQTNVLAGDPDNPVTIQEVARTIVDPEHTDS